MFFSLVTVLSWPLVFIQLSVHENSESQSRHLTNQPTIYSSLQVPGAVILSTFGFNSGAYWKDVQNLGIMASTFFTVAFLWLQFRVNERR